MENEIPEYLEYITWGVGIIVALSAIAKVGIEFFKYKLDVSKTKKETKELKIQRACRLYSSLVSNINTGFLECDDIEKRRDEFNQAYSIFEELAFGLSINTRRYCLDLLARLKRALMYQSYAFPKPQNLCKQNNEDLCYFNMIITIDETTCSSPLYDVFDAELDS